MVKSKGDVHCTSLLISRKAAIIGGVEADCVVVNGKVEGPICGSEVVLKSHADVVGDVHCQHLASNAVLISMGAQYVHPQAIYEKHPRSSPRGCVRQRS